MYKVLLFVLLIVFQTVMMAVQLDEERGMHLLFELKHAVNRSAHAAASQIDEAQLSEGIWAIDEEQAIRTLAFYLQANLRLDEDNAPLSDSLLRAPVEIVAAEVINADQSFPYLYRNETYDYEVMLKRPGVVMIIRAEYPRIFNVIEPIVWTVKGTAELYPPFS